MKTDLVIDNIKCQTCADTIKKGLQYFPEVSEVNVDVKKRIVSVSHSNSLSLDSIEERLDMMGYPPKNTLKGFDKVTADVKSYLRGTNNKISKKN